MNATVDDVSAFSHLEFSHNAAFAWGPPLPPACPMGFAYLFRMMFGASDGLFHVWLCPWCHLTWATRRMLGRGRQGTEEVTPRAMVLEAL